MQQSSKQYYIVIIAIYSKSIFHAQDLFGENFLNIRQVWQSREWSRMQRVEGTQWILILISCSHIFETHNSRNVAHKLRLFHFRTLCNLPLSVSLHQL